jgi:radical SAM superfamily enzyme YgiQ (UPF0313 family)
MSWKIKEKYREILAGEQGAILKNWGGKLTLCLVYPNHYATAMSNLGFQAVYSLCNDLPDVVCERAFLPSAAEMKEYEKTGSPLLSLESQRPITDFDVVAFSVSFENDYLNLPIIFELSAIPPFSCERATSFPLIIAGGAALFLNPEPVADLVDIVCVGEGEAILPAFLELLRAEQGVDRGELLSRASLLPGVYVPSLYEVSHDGHRVTAITARAGAPSRVRRAWEPDLGRSAASSTLFTPGTEFSDMYLIEVSRGCPRGCRFCAAGFIYHPYRRRPLELLRQEAERGLAVKERLGLVGAAVSDHRDLGELCRFIADRGGKVSISSLRIDALDDDLLDILHAGGHKTVALAPEGGSQRLRDLVRKGIGEEQILMACDILIGRDILNLKLYFIIGLPTESMADLEEMIDLVAKIRERVIAAARKNRRLGSILLSVNPFIPKPFTPFQWRGMEDVSSLEKKYTYLRRAVGKMSNVRIQTESLRESYLQALLSRGDRRLAALLVTAGKAGGIKRAARELAIDTDFLVFRTIPLDEILPWDIIDSGDRERLVEEYDEAFGNRTD